jgi:hypothetical protein
LYQDKTAYWCFENIISPRMLLVITILGGLLLLIVLSLHQLDEENIYHQYFQVGFPIAILEIFYLFKTYHPHDSAWVTM